MSAETLIPTYSSGASKSPSSPSPVTLHSCDTAPQVSPFLQTVTQPQHKKTCMAEGPLPLSQRDHIFYRSKSTEAEKYRRHSTDGASPEKCVRTTGERGRFHPYRRQYSDGALPGCPSACPRSLDCFQGLGIPEILPLVEPHGDQAEDQRSWDLYDANLQGFRPSQSGDRFAAPQEPPCYPTPVNGTYTTLHPLQHFPGGILSTEAQPVAPPYTYNCIAPSGPQNTPLQSIFPKPIYSYSILIFMALRNSKTGSLPVSEIYSFMTENFPYFKTAPDGWKNSVRHNLSLNKCFEKVENKMGNSSRKGCLWALNPAKVEKMQEELQKWRRKDPLAVRKSMARPEELDRLIGDRPERWKSFPAQHSLTNSHSYTTPHPPQGGLTIQTSPQSHTHCFATTHCLPPDLSPLACFLPGGQQPLLTLSSRTGAIMEPPGYSVGLQAELCGTTGMQELLMEGELSNDVDMINPSLTDLQLQGHLWEELKDDSLAPDSLVVITGSPLVSSDSDVKNRDQLNEEFGAPSLEDKAHLSNLHVTGLYSTTFTGMDSIAGYVSVADTVQIPLV